MANEKATNNDMPTLYNHIELMIIFAVITLIIYCIIIIQCLMTKLPNNSKNQREFRISLFIASTFEMGFAILQPLSIQNYTDKAVGTIARFVIYDII